MIDKKKSTITKRKNIDIDLLRESLVIELTGLLEKLEFYFSKLDKKNCDSLINTLIQIFHWVNQEIKLFIEDPTIFNRNKLYQSLAKIKEYDTILNKIKIS